MITSSAQLQDLVKIARSTDAVAIDTEFVWTRTYYPRLGLIQLALSDEKCFLIDPLAVEDLSSLGELLADQKVIKILHDAPQDLTILHTATGRVPVNIFDTRLAAGFAGLPATLSLGNLIQELLEIKLSKTETRTDWLKRPLDDKQIRYAMDDVRYLRAARIILINRIIGPEIKSWLQEELGILNHPQLYNSAAEKNRYEKLRGAKNLDGEKLAILRELDRWREKEAKKLNRPRGHVIADTTLVEIARNRTLTIEQLRLSTTLSERAVERWGGILIAAVQKGINTPEKQRPQLEHRSRLNAKNTATLHRLNDFIRLKSKVQGIDPTLIGNHSELQSLVKILNKSSKSKMLRQLEGWRKTFLKDFFNYSIT